MKRLFLSSASVFALTAYTGFAQADVWENIADNYGDIDVQIDIDANSITGGSYLGLNSTFGISAINEGKIIGTTANSTIEVGSINVLSNNTFDDDVVFEEDPFEDNVFEDDVIDVVLEFAANNFTARNTAYNNSDEPINAQITIDVEEDINDSFGGLSTVGFGAINQDSSITIAGGDVTVDVGSGELNILSFNTFNDDVTFESEVVDNEVFDDQLVDLDFGGDGNILLENFVRNPGPSGDGTINAYVDIDATNIENGSFVGAPVQVGTDDTDPENPVPIFENFAIKTQAVAAQNGGEITATYGAVDINVGDVNFFSGNTFGGELGVSDDIVENDVFDDEVIDVELDLGELTARNFAENVSTVNGYVDIFTEEDIVNSFNVDGTIAGEGNPATVIETRAAGAINNGAITVGWGDVDIDVGDINLVSNNTFEDDVDFDIENLIGDDGGVFGENVFDEAVINIEIDLDDGDLTLTNYADNTATINGYVEINNVSGSGDIEGSFNTVPINLGESTVIRTSAVGAVNQGATDPENPDEAQPATINLNFGSVSASVGDLNVFSGNDFQGDVLFEDIFEDDVFAGDGDQAVIEIAISWDGLLIENRADNTGQINAYVDIGTSDTDIKDSFTDGLPLSEYPELSNGIQTSGIGALNNGEINIAVGSVYAEVGDINVFSDNKFNSNGGDPTFTEDLFKNDAFPEEVVEAEDAEGVAVNATVGDINLVSNNEFYGPVNFNSSNVFGGDVFNQDVVDANFAVVDSTPFSSTTYQNIAYNEGNIDAYVTINVADISGSFSSIGTSGIGASNVGTISFTQQQLP